MTRRKMAVADRAAQFMPFAALKGFPEALRRAEKQAEADADRTAVRIYVAQRGSAEKGNLQNRHG